MSTRESCQTELLSEYLDQELEADAHQRVEDHLRTCERCSSLLGELRGVMRHAGALADRTPPRDLWPGIAERIGISAPAPVVSIGRRKALRRVSLSVPQLLAAGVAAVALGGTAGVVGFRALNGGADETPVVVEAENVAPATFAAMAIETPYDDAITDLMAILQRDRARLSPGTVRALEENLAIIDGAIERARQALLQDPESDYFREHLERTVRQKLDLLRRANDIVSRS